MSLYDLRLNGAVKTSLNESHKIKSHVFITIDKALSAVHKLCNLIGWIVRRDNSCSLIGVLLYISLANGLFEIADFEV